jgi:hypothetical protein
MTDEHNTKRCTGCGAVKPLSEFARDGSCRSGLRSRCRACGNAYSAARAAANPDKVRGQRRACQAVYRAKVRAAYYAAKQKERKGDQEAVAAALALVPLVESLIARVTALEALLTPRATVGRIAPERSRRRRAVHEHHTPAPAMPSATPPPIRTIRDIVAHDGVTPGQAKRIQEREVLARAEWRPSVLNGAGTGL